MFICEFCNKEFKSKTSVIAHKIRCKLNPNMKFWNTNKGKGSGHSAWNKGLTKESDERIKKYSETFSKRSKAGKYNLSRHHSKETKELLSKKRSEYLASAKNAGGFRDVGWYEVENINHKKYVVRGTWEYNVALKLNELNILWERNIYLNYFIDDVKKLYNPDFYLPELNEYIEVKGYFSEKDKIKMDAVLDQNPNVIIRFMKSDWYTNFINRKILISDVPIYKFGMFESGYKKKGQIKFEKKIKYCNFCGKIIYTKSKYFCSIECYNQFRLKNKRTEKRKRIKFLFNLWARNSKTTKILFRKMF